MVESRFPVKHKINAPVPEFGYAKTEFGFGSFGT